MEETGYESRQTSRGMLLLWFLRGRVVLTLHSQNTTAVVFQSKSEVYHDYFSLKTGENCAILGCGSCRRTKGIGIWKLPAPKDEAHKKWRD